MILFRRARLGGRREAAGTVVARDARRSHGGNTGPQERSGHPQVSFTAWGLHAERVTARHQLAYSLGEGSPLARIYDLDGWILLLGVGYESNSSFHLAEYRAGVRPGMEEGAPVMVCERRVWKTWPDIALDPDPFPAIGAAYERTGGVAVRRVGSAESRLLRQRPAVDFAVRWLLQHARNQP